MNMRELDPVRKSRLAVRNACTVAGRCPDCGCAGRLDRIADGIYRLTFEHEPSCVVLTDEEA
jgi:hypothetical protein